MTSPDIYGLMAEFDDPNALVAATHRAYAEGYREMDAYSPFPIEELHEALGGGHTRLPLIVLMGGVLGCIGGYSLQYWVAAIAYPINVGGKPFHSWPAFIPVTFECTILAAALSAVLGMLALNGLPTPYHPVFNVLPRDRVEGREIRSRSDAAVPRDAQPSRSDDGGRLMRAPQTFRLAPSMALLMAALGMAAAGCRQDLHDQPKYIPLRESPFFADQRSARPLVPGTVARGQLREDALLYTGKVNGADATVFPFPIDERVMARGQQRFDIYCSPCHGRTGLGDGMVVRRGYRRPPSYDDERLRTAPVGHFFDVITNGFGAMPDYAAQVKPEDRWAIVAYIRALQLSRRGTLSDVPAAERDKLR